jgi:hypothetical protein
VSPLSSSLVPPDSGLSALREIALSGRPLVPLPRRERERKLALYLDFLRRRDGVPDRKARRLSRREPFFEELARDPVLWDSDLDRAAFQRYLHARPPADLDPRLLWLLAAAKANRGERWAIERELARREARGEPGDAWSVYIGLEETYHTRILADACRSVGFEAPLLEPPRGQRAFIRALLPLPRRLRLPLTLASEIFGCACFAVLLERASVFAGRRAVVERLQRLVREILTDEAGHVLYCRSRLGPAGLAAARLALPVIGRVLLRDLAEFAHLAGGERAFLDRLAGFDLAQLC